MLVLSRKLNEEVWIAPDVIVKVIEIDRGKVRIGFIAPPETKILRRELFLDGNPPSQPAAA